MAYNQLACPNAQTIASSHARRAPYHCMPSIKKNEMASPLHYDCISHQDATSLLPHMCCRVCCIAAGNSV